MEENKEQSNSSSFEDLSNENGIEETDLETSASNNDLEPTKPESEPELIDIIGNGQLTKKVLLDFGMLLHKYICLMMLLCLDHR